MANAWRRNVTNSPRWRGGESHEWLRDAGMKGMKEMKEMKGNEEMIEMNAMLRSVIIEMKEIQVL